jgi:hypothetical protein
MELEEMFALLLKEMKEEMLAKMDANKKIMKAMQ